MNKIKVVHVVNDLGFGGVQKAVYHLLKALPRERYKLYLYCLKIHFDYPTVWKAQAERFKKLGAEVLFSDQDKSKSYDVGEFCTWLLQNQIDILHTHSYNPNIYGRLAGVLCRKIKIVGHYHNYYDYKWEKENSLIYDKLFVPFTDQLIACSESVQRHISERIGILPEEINVVPNGVDLDEFMISHDQIKLKAEMGIPLNRKVVGIIGRISEQKAQDDFIKAARLIKQSVPDTVFLIVGRASNEKLLKCLRELAVSFGIDKDVIFTGYLTDIQKVFTVLDIVVMPSRWEGFGLILVEAMASGKPIVATDVGPISEVVVPDETALLVPPSEPSSIASRVTHLLENPEEARIMGEKGHERAKMFSWNRAGIQLDNLYKKLMKESRR